MFISSIIYGESIIYYSGQQSVETFSLGHSLVPELSEAYCYQLNERQYIFENNIEETYCESIGDSVILSETSTTSVLVCG